MTHFTDSLIEDFELQEAALNYNTELAKIQKWRGTGKRNIAAMSDEKLKFNYDICIDKGYSYEASVLKKEGKSRGLSWAIALPTDWIKRNIYTLMPTGFDFDSINIFLSKPQSQESLGQFVDSLVFRNKPEAILRYYLVIVLLYGNNHPLAKLLIDALKNFSFELTPEDKKILAGELKTNSDKYAQMINNTKNNISSGGKV